jgi:hypothetical protein
MAHYDHKICHLTKLIKMFVNINDMDISKASDLKTIQTHIQQELGLKIDRSSIESRINK